MSSLNSEPEPSMPPVLLTRGTVASNPGRVRVRYLHYVAHKPLWPMIWLTGCALALLAALSLHGAFWAVSGFCAAALFWHWFRVRLHFRHGCANPAVIVQTSPLLLAVFTDLAMDGGSTWPVIKIMRCSRALMSQPEPVVGQKVATIAVYWPGESRTRWNDFDPRPVGAATPDPQDHDRVMASFQKEDWARLVAGVKRVPVPYSPGLYHIPSV